MNNPVAFHLGEGHSSLPSLRDVLGIGFRHQRLVLGSFLGILLAGGLAVLLTPRLYEANMMILVKHERVDPVVTSEDKPRPEIKQTVTDQDINSEVELLRSRDLLEKTVLVLGLHQAKPGWWNSLREGLEAVIGRAPNPNKAIARAVFKLERKLEVAPVKNSALIRVTYASPDPELAAHVVNTLANLYLEKHLAVHRPPDTFDFFQMEAGRYRKELGVVETQLADFGKQHGVVSVQPEKDATLRQMTDLEAKLRGTEAEITVSREHIRNLEVQAASTPPRMTTQVRTSSGRLLEQLQLTNTNLEVKRVELLRVYKPDFPLVQEVDKQLAETRAAILAAQKTPLLEETTDRDPTYEWLRAELTRGKSELVTLEAQAQATRRNLGICREKAGQLERKELIYQDLVRDAKLAEQNYMVYFRKQEEARITDALDRQRIVNVAIAEAATVPFLPSGPSPSLLLLLVGVVGGLVSGALAFAADHWDPSFHTPQEVESYLNIPVAAAIPKGPR